MRPLDIQYYSTIILNNLKETSLLNNLKQIVWKLNVTSR